MNIFAGLVLLVPVQAYLLVVYAIVYRDSAGGSGCGGAGEVGGAGAEKG